MTLEMIMESAVKSAERRGILYDNISDYLCHIHSEISEIYEEVRDGNPPHEVYGDVEGVEHGIPVELADVIILCLTFASHFNIDIESAIVRKLHYNEIRED